MNAQHHHITMHRHAPWGLTVAMAIAAVVLACAAPAPGQADAPETAPAEAVNPPAPAGASQAIDAHVGRQAFLEAELWIKTKRVPEEAIEPIRVTGVRAVHVTIRRRGPTFGTATATIEDPATTQPSAVNLMDLLRRATAGALTEDLSAPAAQRQEAGTATLDVQFAGPLTRLNLKHLGDLPGLISLGLDGLAIRHEGRWAWAFPGNAIAANANLKSQLTRMLASETLGLTPADLPRIGTDQGPELYRFNVLHLTRLNPLEEIATLVRGNTVIAAKSMDQTAIRDLAVRLASHLQRRQRPDGRFGGAFLPTAGQLKSPASSDAQSALAAFALARQAKMFEPASKEYQTSAGAARRAVDALIKSDVLEEKPANGTTPVAPQLNQTAMTLLAMLETPGVGLQSKSVWRTGTRLLMYMDPATGVFYTDADRVQPASAHGQALAAFALVRLYELNRKPDALERAKVALHGAWTQIEQDPDRAVGTMPWLVYAEIDLQRLGRGAPENLPRLASICKGFWAKQVLPWTGGRFEGANPDTIGGFLLNLSLYNEPTWHSTRVLAAQGLAIRSPAVVPAKDLDPWLVKAGYAARFINQLTFRPSGCYYVRDPAQAIGGTRLALWNNELPLDTTALSLIAISELHHGLAIRKSSKPGRIEIRGLDR